MNYVEWIRQVDEGTRAPAYLVRVTEPFLWDSMKEVIQKDLLGGNFLDFNYQEVAFEDLSGESFLTATETLPFMGDRRAIVIENVPLQRDEVKKNEALLEILAGYLKEPNRSTILFLHFLGQAPFKGKVFKAMAPYLQTVDLYRLDRRSLESFIHKRMGAKGVRADKALPAFLADRSGYLDYQSETTLFSVANMVDVALGMSREGRLSLEEAKAALADPLEESIFALMDAFGGRKRSDCLSIFQDFRKISMEAGMVFNMTIRQVRNLIGVKLLKARRISLGEGTRRLGLSSFEYRKLLGFVDKYSLEELYALHRKLFEMDVAMKSKSYDLLDGMERFFASI